MAVTSTALTARLRLTDQNDKTVATLSNVAPEASPDELTSFALAYSAMRTSPIGGVFTVVDSELTETE